VQPQFQERVDAIIRVILDRVNPSLDEATLSSETCLVETGLALDSVALLELVTGLEDDLDIMIDESELRREVLESIGSFARYLSEQSP
jgi:acyl carrier protein